MADFQADLVISSVLFGAGVAVAVVGAVARALIRERVNSNDVYAATHAAINTERLGGPPAIVVARQNSVIGIAAALIGPAIVVGTLGVATEPLWQRILIALVTVMVTALLVWYGGVRFRPMLTLDTGGVRVGSGSRLSWDAVDQLNFIATPRQSRAKRSRRFELGRLTFSRNVSIKFDQRWWTPPRRILYAAETFKGSEKTAVALALEPGADVLDMATRAREGRFNKLAICSFASAAILWVLGSLTLTSEQSMGQMVIALQALCAVVAVVSGLISISQIRRTGEAGTLLARIGAGFGGLALLVYVSLGSLFAGFFGG